MSQRGGLVAGPDEQVGVPGGLLDDRLDPAAKALGQGKVGGNERMAAVDGRQDECPSGTQPAGQVGEGRGRVAEVLHGEGAEHDVEGRRREGVRARAQVRRDELVEVGERALHRRVDVDADKPADSAPVRRKRRMPAAAGVEGDDHRGAVGARRVETRRAGGLGVADGIIEGGAEDLGETRREAQPPERRLAAARARLVAGATAHHADAVTASTIPCSSSQRSASIAARQPSPAATTAWR